MLQNSKGTSQKKDRKYQFTGNKKTIALKLEAIKLMKESFLNVAYISGQLGIHRVSFYRWLKNDPEFERAFQETTEQIYDDAETELQKHIHEDRDVPSLLFFLRTKVKHRGYIEKSEIEHSGVTAAVINLIETPMEVIKSEQLKNKSKTDGDASSPK